MRILATPLFNEQGNYNKEGKRMWAVDDDLVCDSEIGTAYFLYRKDGKPDNPSPVAPDDEYYLYIRVRDRLVPLKVTKHDLIQKVGYKANLNDFYHGREDEREAAFLKARKAGKVSEFLEQERKMIEYLGAIKSLQCNWIIEYCRSHINKFLRAKKAPKRYRPSFIGAFLCDEVPTYYELIKRREKSID